MAERPVPKTKQELIALLKQQLEKVQDQINSMQSILQEERDKRKQLTTELEQKQAKVQELIENQTKTLGDKVNEGLYNTLEAANKMRAEAESEVRRISEDNNILNEKITHKDSKNNEDRKNIDLNIKKVSALEQKKTDLQRKEAALLHRKEEIRSNYELMKREHERIQKQEQELRGHLQNAKKLKMYLNKHLQSSLKQTSNQQNIGGTKRTSNPSTDNFWNS